MKKPAYLKPNKTAQPLSRKTTKAPTENVEILATPEHWEVAERAYYIYLERGSPEDQEIDHWLEAEAHVMHEQSTSWSTMLTTI